MSAATAVRIARRLADKLGVAPTRDAVAAIAPERVLQAHAKLRADLLARPDPDFWGEAALTYLPWAPTVDGATIPEAPIARLRAGAAADIDLLVGSNVEETRLFLLSDGTIDRFTQEALVAMATAYGLGAEGCTPTAPRARAPARASCSARCRPTGTGAFPPSGWQMRMRPTPAPPPTCTNSLGARRKMGGRLGAAHGVEYPLCLTPSASEPSQCWGGIRPRRWPIRCMGPGWPSPAAEIAVGPRYDVARRRMMRFDMDSRVVDNPLGRELALWTGLR